ncbi:hypothetical protein [Caballeronia sordidicola]|uniref:Uncharacterized protein n=1 Tax=Caballeronia sordidicola TaxID=196367 RepID=A0A242N0E5_CABSO|nr:hypothetical protein [Caballeronia sordidicola]OTP77125.1 hypothetical protein PAMC26577_09165 [Caballeronia sordidicola]
MHRLTMPVDFKPGGSPLAYPSRGSGFLAWLGIWALCCAIVSGFVLLIWPASMPANGVFFWFCVAGVPNGFFLILAGFARAVYETAYLHALYGNQHRQKWNRERVAYAQRPLYVLDYAYHLPLGAEKLALAVLSGKPLIAMQNTRTGVDRVLHMRFPDSESLVATADADDDLEAEIATPMNASNVEAGPTAQDGFCGILRQLLLPLANSLRALSRSDSKHSPAVRLVVNDPDVACRRLEQLSDALAVLSLPPLECDVAHVSDGLMLVDAWLDANERRPLLVIAAEWHDKSPLAGSTEGGVAVLLSSGASIGPPAAVATLHRPVAVNLDSLGDGITNAILWGNTTAAKVKRSWVTGINLEDDPTLASAFSKASLSTVDDPHAYVSPGRIVGHLGPGAGWLAIAAAIESGMNDPQLIINRTETVQSAVLYAHPRSTHEDRAQ